MNSTSSPKIWGIGLPRSAGQTLQMALKWLFPSREVWHSPGSNWNCMDEHPREWIGAVEVFAPLPWLEKNYPGSLYIYNLRELDPWIKSCASVYHKSQELNWNHPLWRYPLHQFESYYEEYELDRLDINRAGIEDERFLTWDITRDAAWEPLCEFLRIDPPKCPFPRMDVHRKRRQPVIKQAGSGLPDFRTELFDFEL